VDIPYSIIADCFRKRTVVPFLGSAASFVGATGKDILPSGAALAKVFAEHSAYPGPATDPLTKVAQFLEDVQADRNYILGAIETRFIGVRQDYRSSVTDFLAGLPLDCVPKLILTTNYDVLVENALEKRGIPYIAISHVMRGSKNAGRFLCSEPSSSDEPGTHIRTLKELRQYLFDLEEKQPSHVIVYKMHGTARMRFGEALIDSVVLTENDYIEFFALDLLKKIPETVVDQLSRGHLLFLGYSLEDWNFRVLLRKINHIQQQAEMSQRHWALLLSASAVETKFWDKRNVNVYQQSLDTSLSVLLGILNPGATT
jgi:hypothetical protein